MSTKKRLDQLVVELGLASTPMQAQAIIMAGEILVNNHAQSKAGDLIPEDAEVRLKSDKIKYVSRGGVKLEGALQSFKIDVTNLCCLDVGASTGGFTDCLLQHGARKIFTIDVGKGQLDPKIRNDRRVTWKESFHANELTPELLGEPVDLAVVDVSFISLKTVLPFIIPCIRNQGFLLAMIKPQFEVQPKDLVKGIVKNEDKRKEAISSLKNFAQNELQLKNIQVADAAIKGPKGNQETFLFATRTI